MIYLDANATTPVADEIQSACVDWWRDFYNPASSYTPAKKLQEILEQAKQSIADLVVGSTSEEWIITSSGTESNNTALASLQHFCGAKKGLVGCVEHSSVLKYAEFLQQSKGLVYDYLPLDEQGSYDVIRLNELLATEQYGWLSLQWVNNETGVIHDMLKIAAIADKYGVVLHVDAIQAAGKIPLQVTGDYHGIRLLSISGHKLYAPKGVGALYVNQNMPFQALLHGGGQQQGRRSSTENTLGVRALGLACEIAKQQLGDFDQITQRRNQLWDLLQQKIPRIESTVNLTKTVGNTLSIIFPNCPAEALLLLLNQYGVYCSAASACMTGKERFSHVLQAMKLPLTKAKHVLRLSLTRYTTEEEVQAAANYIAQAVSKVQSVQSNKSTVGNVVIYHTE